ncbi:LysR substrate-binding domain-containing protein [Mesorhizobium sp. L2C084A000]|uniref:LysR substrate-binding domain-containing protein n=1 Tax=Mesorhizobium sp. L2C084A000 TaxID=1287116 RepID=UPI0003CFBD68|nr:LysR substrate-binding domain-containing protein [Mesorhizobium sp. L2C084A000]ESZ23059.1 LysR family transcriptional regulator [Mesorhizobium sp. L2C084A000]
MRSLRHLLPSAGSLIVFEAAGLEEQLGAKLFQRRHRQVLLTEAGERFHADVSLGLSHIRKSAEDLRLQATGGHVTLAASTAFGSFWMMPRLQQFRDELPGIDLRIQTADRDLDIIAEGIPLGVRGGAPRDWPDYHSLPLADEEIFPVAGTSYAAKFGLPKFAAELATHRLIHLEEPYREAASWDEWFQSAGANLSDTARGLRINDYGLVIQGVMEGQGIALGWRHLAERLLASGLLVPVTDHVLKTGKAFYVVWPKNRELSDNARKVRDWLAAQA